MNNHLCRSHYELLWRLFSSPLYERSGRFKRISMIVTVMELHRARYLDCQ